MYRFKVCTPPADLARADGRIGHGTAYGQGQGAAQALSTADAGIENMPYSHPQAVPGETAPGLPGPVPASAPAPPVLPTGISRLDRFFSGGFSGGQMTLLEGPADFVLQLTSRFAVAGVVAYDRPVLIIDGGNTADPYGFAGVCRRWHVEQRSVMARILIARAFTVYQLDTLLTRTVEEQLKELAPAVVIVSALNSMYLDPDVNWDEARGIFHNDLRMLRELTERYGTITVVTNFGQHPSYHAMELGRSLRKIVSERIFVKARSRHRLRLVRNGMDVMDYTPLPAYQCSLDEFFPGGAIDG